jgi:hypothetical protein
MSIDLNLLKQELLTDPAQLGYDQFVAVRNDISIHNLISEIKYTSDFLVSRGRITKDEFIELTSQIVFALMLAKRNGNNDADFWLSVFDRLIANSETINADDPSLEYILDQMINENLLTIQEKDAIKKRQGSRSEVLFGTCVTIDDISNSLNEVEI